VDGVEGVDGVDGLDSRGIRGGRDSDWRDLRDEPIGGRYTRPAPSTSTSAFGPGLGEVAEERVEGGIGFPFWGHKDEARFALGAGSDPTALDTDGEGGPVKFDEYLYELV